MIVGVDVSKDKLDVFILETKKHYVIKNTQASIASFFKNKLKDQPIQLVVFEATGGYERLLHLYLSGNELPHHRAHALRVKRFGEATGFFAKTDHIDAKLLALYGSQDGVIPDKPLSKKQFELQAMGRLIQSIKDQLQATSNRSNMTSTKEESAFYKKHIRFLERELLKAKSDFDKRVEELEEVKRKRDLLQTMKGVGTEVSGILVASLPELGELSRESICCLVGVAPRNNDSGTRQGRRQISHGRFHVRKALYMSALVSIRFNPPMKAFYEKLLAKGKAKKVALIAVARKVLIILNAMIKNGTPWVEGLEKI